jgi:hypothetical protein
VKKPLEDDFVSKLPFDEIKPTYTDETVTLTQTLGSAVIPAKSDEDFDLQVDSQSEKDEEKENNESGIFKKKKRFADLHKLKPLSS